MLHKNRAEIFVHQSCVLSLGADLSDYFNYGFNEDTWKAYCEKQKRIRMGLEVIPVTSTTNKITVINKYSGIPLACLPSHFYSPNKSFPYKSG